LGAGRSSTKATSEIIVSIVSGNLAFVSSRRF
jgi:hypothetical protein